MTLKRFLIFGGVAAPRGGWCDFKSEHDDFYEAEGEVREKLNDLAWVQIVDIVDRKLYQLRIQNKIPFMIKGEVIKTEIRIPSK